MENAFLGFEVEVVIEGDLKNVSDGGDVSSSSAGGGHKVFGGDGYVIHVNPNSSA
jgi:hypothetical protein